MAEPTKLPGKSDPPGEQGPGTRRRRLLQGGLAATPLLTLVSRPVLGAARCVSASGFHSMPASRHGPEQVCSGRSPDYWKQPLHFAEWPPPYVPGTGQDENGAIKPAALAESSPTRFNAVFSPSPFEEWMTLLDVLEAGGGPPLDVARHIVAALLNAASGFTPVLEVPAVLTMWEEYASMGYFEPTAGVRWYNEEIVDYLLSTMPS
jgi:hypothetical protein